MIMTTSVNVKQIVYVNFICILYRVGVFGWLQLEMYFWRIAEGGRVTRYPDEKLRRKYHGEF